MKRTKRRTRGRQSDDQWILEMQEQQNQQYVAYLERGWHTIRRVLPNISEVDGALDGLQTLFEKLSDVPIQGSQLIGVGALVGLVRERVESVHGQLSVTQQHWKNAHPNKETTRQSPAGD